MGFVTDVDLEKLEQKSIDLIFIMESKLADKIDKLGEAIDTKMQSLENGFSALQNTLNELMLTFLRGQEDGHKELIRISNCLNEHEDRLKELEEKELKEKKE